MRSATLTSVVTAVIGSGLANAGCSGDANHGSTPATATDASESTADGSTGTLETSEAVSGSSESSGSEARPPTFANDIRLLRLTANQAVQVELVDQGEAVDPEQWSAQLVAGRTTLVRGFWTLHADFEPRALIGRLDVTYPTGESVRKDFPITIAGEASDGGASLEWLLKPDEVVPGMKLRARILDPDPENAPGTVSDPPPVAPLQGATEVVLLDAPLELRVVLVPVLHQFEDCEQVPTPTERDVQAMRVQLEQANAVQTAILSVAEPMAYTESIGLSESAFSPVLAALAQRRAADDPGPNVYYYGLLDSCDGFPPGLLGQAIGIPDAPLMELENERISTGRWLGSGAAAAETFVHEIGHSQGRRHVSCTGGEGGPDLAYPHDNGRIGVWGLGIYDFALRSPTLARDYMSYCANEWVSDYGWQQTLATIEVLTSWDFLDVPEPLRTPVLTGLIHENGAANWWIAWGAVPSSRLNATAVLEFEGFETRTAASVQPIPHGLAQYVTIELPGEPAELTGVRVQLGARTIEVAPDAIARP